MPTHFFAILTDDGLDAIEYDRASAHAHAKELRVMGFKAKVTECESEDAAGALGDKVAMRGYI